MKTLFGKGFAFSILSATFILQANASELKEQKTVFLDEITVTATKTPIKLEQVPANVGITVSDDIKAKASSTDTFKAIKHIAGVEPAGGALLGAIFIRGKTPSILNNGRDMNFFSGVLQNPALSMNSIDRIEVLKGPQAAIHGAKAVSGVVNIIKKKGDANHPFIETGVFSGTGKAFGANLSLGGGVKFVEGGEHLLTFLM